MNTNIDPSELARLTSRGTEIINSLIGTSFPNIQSLQIIKEALYAEKPPCSDAIYKALCCAMYEVNVHATHLEMLLELYNTSLPKGGNIEHCFPRIKEIIGISDDELISIYNGSVAIEPIQITHFFKNKHYTSVKVNHAHWEYISLSATLKYGLKYYRQMMPFPFFPENRSDDILYLTLQALSRHLKCEGKDLGNFNTNNFSFGISLNSGDGLARDDLMIPLNHVVKGAMIGVYAYFTEFLPAKKYIFSDGSFAKMLVWDNKLTDFFYAVKEHSDIIAFIVPEHLSRIMVRDWAGQTERIIAPSNRVHEYWPAFLAYSLARLEELLSTNKRLTVMTQCGLLSAPFGILFHLLLDSYPNAEARLIDMGQALDVATYPEYPVGRWIQIAANTPELSNLSESPITLNKNSHAP